MAIVMHCICIVQLILFGVWYFSKLFVLCVTVCSILHISCISHATLVQICWNGRCKLFKMLNFFTQM